MFSDMCICTSIFCQTINCPLTVTSVLGSGLLLGSILKVYEIQTYFKFYIVEYPAGVVIYSKEHFSGLFGHNEQECVLCLHVTK